MRRRANSFFARLRRRASSGGAISWRPKARFWGYVCLSALVMLAVRGNTEERFKCAWSYVAPNHSQAAKHSDAVRLGSGYQTVHMYEEAIETLSALLADELGKDHFAFVDHQLGRAYYHAGELEQAAFHSLRAAESGRFSTCWRASLWRRLAAISFEAQRYEEATEYGERWHGDLEALRLAYDDVGPPAATHVLALAKYWSHVDRQRALSYAEIAAARWQGRMDPATANWIDSLRVGDAPADIAPMARPWLREPVGRLVEEEIERRMEARLERRTFLVRPSEPPTVQRVIQTDHESPRLVSEFELPSSMDFNPSVDIEPPTIDTVPSKNARGEVGDRVSPQP